VTGALRAGTRSSPLALWQTGHVAQALAAVDPELRCEPFEIHTRGDRERATPIAALGETGAFTEALEAALLAGEFDLAVHSLKDLPIADRPGLVIAAVTLREDPRDALVTTRGATLAQLRGGARVGTSSPRRRAQLLAARPDLVAVPVRGNVDSRVHKVLEGELDAVVLAAAGLHRLGLQARIAEYFDLAVMLPAPGQGALAVQCRADDPRRARIARVDEPPVRAAVGAERAFHAALGGGCTAPIGALARVDGSLELAGVVADPDGRRLVRVDERGAPAEAEAVGRRAAERALAAGARALLA
jgi:hydroxymethylbilane synthase